MLVYRGVLKLPLIYAHRPIVVEVISPSHAQRAGLKAGDIIFSVNGENVQTVKGAFNQLRNARENVLYVLRFDQPGRYNLKRIVIVKKVTGVSASGKPTDFDSVIRRFESCHPMIKKGGFVRLPLVLS